MFCSWTCSKARRSPWKPFSDGSVGVKKALKYDRKCFFRDIFPGQKREENSDPGRKASLSHLLQLPEVPFSPRSSRSLGTKRVPAAPRERRGVAECRWPRVPPGCGGETGQVLFCLLKTRLGGVRAACQQPRRFPGCNGGRRRQLWAGGDLARPGGDRWGGVPGPGCACCPAKASFYKPSSDSGLCVCEPWYAGARLNLEASFLALASGPFFPLTANIRFYPSASPLSPA